jgi:hypothetical protein
VLYNEILIIIIIDSRCGRPVEAGTNERKHQEN